MQEFWHRQPTVWIRDFRVIPSCDDGISSIHSVHPKQQFWLRVSLQSDHHQLRSVKIVPVSLKESTQITMWQPIWHHFRQLYRYRSRVDWPHESPPRPAWPSRGPQSSGSRPAQVSARARARARPDPALLRLQPAQAWHCRPAQCRFWLSHLSDGRSPVWLSLSQPKPRTRLPPARPARACSGAD